MKITEMSDETLMRSVRHLRKIKEDLIINYKKILELTDNESRIKDIKMEIFFLSNTDIENVSKDGESLINEARKRGLA